MKQEKRKKVLFTATVDSHILQFHLPFLKLFQDNGYEVHVATNGTEKIPYCDVRHTVCFAREPIKLNNLKAIRQLKKIINNEKFEIIHCHTPMGGVVTRLAAKVARKNGTRVIYTAHGFHFYKGAPIKNWLFFYPVEWYLAKFTDTLITINKEDYERAKKKFNKRCKNIEYVNGVGIDVLKFEKEISKFNKTHIRKKLGLDSKDFILTCIARLDKNKNQGFLIETMDILTKTHNNIHLLLVGPDEYNGKYKKLCLKKNLNKYVHFFGKKEHIAEILAISDIVVSASKREGLPINIIEALASSIPVVALECRGINELISNDINGFICKNKNEFIMSIEKTLLMNIENLERIIQSNRIKAKQYDISYLIDLYKKIYFK